MSNTKLRPGALSTEDMEFIREHAVSMTIAEIAAALHRREQPILKFITEEGLASKTFIPNLDEEYVKILKELRKCNFYEELKLQLDEDEIKYFTSHWVELILQFKSDVLAAEKMQIKELIILDILVNRVMRKRLMARKDIEKYSKLCSQEYDKPEAQRDMAALLFWESELGQAKTAEVNLTGEQNKLQQDKKELYKSLKATRDQRFQKVESGEKTFMTLLKSLYEDEERKKEGELAALLKVATDKKRDELSHLHQFADGVVDLPLLNCDSVLKQKERDERKEDEPRQDIQDGQEEADKDEFDEDESE
jgi:hypothetical protein